jgi:antitoxin ParD1/3/4
VDGPVKPGHDGVDESKPASFGITGGFMACAGDFLIYCDLLLYGIGFKPVQEGLAMATLTISLPDSLKTFIETQLAAKGYGNVSEYFRSLLRDAQAKEEEARLEALLLEGLASNRLPLDARFLKGIEAKTEEIVEKHKNRKRS